MGFERRYMDSTPAFGRRNLFGRLNRTFSGGNTGGLEYALTATKTLRNIDDRAVTDYIVDTGVNVEQISEPIKWTSSDESVATVDQSGLAQYVSPGTATITATAPSEDFQVSETLTFEDAGPAVDPDPFGPDTLRGKLKESVDSRITGLDPNASKDLYTSFPSNSNYTDASETRGAVDEFIRNSKFWAKDVPNITCISPSHIRSGETTHRRAPTGTLISPYHYITNKHLDFNPPVGSTLYFVGLDGALYSSIILGDERVGTTDLQIGILSDAVNIQSAKFFPSGVYDELFESYLENVPALCLDQQEHGMIHIARDRESLSEFKIPAENSIYYPYVDKAEDNRVWDGPGIERGDSGNPAFFIYKSELVLSTVWTGGYGGGGYSVTLNADEIQSVMDSLSITYSKPQHNLTYVTL